MDIVVTIPKSEYKNDDLETKDMEENNYVQFWKFTKLPIKLNIGDRIYFVKNKKIESSMNVIDILKNQTERCFTTNRSWNGHIVYIDNLRYENLPFEVKGFQGFRYRWWE